MSGRSGTSSEVTCKQCCVVLGMLAGLSACDGHELVVPDPPWSSPSCYDARAPFETSNAWTADTFPLFPTIGGVAGVIRIEGYVVGDTFHGWRDPYHKDGVGLTNVTQDGQARGDVAIELSVVDPNQTCLPVDLKGQRVSLVTYQSAPFEDVDHLTGGGAAVLRNADGQLLWAQVSGSLDEHGAEALPELRTSKLPSNAPIRHDFCYPTPPKGERTLPFSYQRSRMMLTSQGESKVFDERTMFHSIAIGCVEYLVTASGIDVVSGGNCWYSEQHFSMSIIRRALLEPGPGCTP